MKAMDFDSGKKPTWCPGCGNFAIWNAIKGALAELDINGKDVVNISGIGCSGKMLNHLRTYGFHALHGRTLPLATGIKLANHKLTVIVNGGDGDGYGMGMGHFIHTIRRNIDITYLVHDNHVYGLTTGQASPTTDIGLKSKSTPSGVVDKPINPLMVALSAGAAFVARGYSGDYNHLKEMIKEGIKFKGFAFIDILQPCVTFGKHYSYDYYNERVYKLDGSYDTSDFDRAIEIAQDKDKIALGVIYKKDEPEYTTLHPQLSEKPLMDINNKIRNIDGELKKFK